MALDIDPGKKLKEYQTGIIEQDNTDKYSDLILDKNGKFQNNQDDNQIVNDFNLANYLNSTTTPNAFAEDYTEEARAAGFGRSRYDDDFASGMDLEQSRALSQSNSAKIVTGLTKGGVTAATTAVETTAGTIFGLGSALYELAFDANGNGRSFMDTLDAGVNNWLSDKLVKIQRWSEEQMPNYRTQEERSEQYQREWYKHMGTANFIGDSILKNFGFTVGAMAGGVAWSKLIGLGLSRQLASNIMKGAVVAAEGDAEVNAAMKTAAELVQKGKTKAAKEALERAGQALGRGTAVTVDTDALSANLKAAGKAINKYGAKMQLYGSAIAAMGEGTVEGVMAKDEFLEDYTSKLQQQYAREYNSIEQDIINSNDSRFMHFVGVADAEGKIYKYEPRLKEAGLAELQKRQQEVTDKYQELMAEAEKQGERLSSTTFLLNLPILTTSNMIQFGRMFSGGWSTARNTLSSEVKGGLRKVGNKIVANYEAKGTPLTRAVFGSLKVGTSEASEEMLQGTASSGAKQVAADRLAADEQKLSSFNDAGYDEEAINSVRSWFESMYTGGKDYLSDIKNWQEGALGAITGLFGIPGKRWNGGIVGAIKDAKEGYDASKKAADTLNKLVNSEDFQTRWRAYIRHLKYDNDMSKALVADDEYAWHSADDSQIIGDVVDFASTGRLEDLNQIVEEYTNLSDSDVEEIRAVIKKNSKDSSEDWTRDLSNADIRQKVSAQATRLKDYVEQYKETYNALATRAPIGSSKEYLKELVYTSMQTKALEKRFMTLFGETMDSLESVLLAMSSLDDNGNVVSREQTTKNFKALRDAYERIYAGSLLPIKLPGVFQKDIDAKLNLLEDITKKEDPELYKKVIDMRKLSESRKAFYNKLQTLQQNNGQEKFNEQALSQEKLDSAAEKEYAKQEVEGLNSLDDIKREYFSKGTKDKAEYISTLEDAKNSNGHVADFLKLFHTYNDFRTHVLDNYQNLVNKDTGSLGEMTEVVLNNLFKNSKNATEFIDKLAAGEFNKAEFDRELDRIVETKELSEEFAIPVLRDDQFNKITSSLQSAAQEFKTALKDTRGRDVINPENTVEQKQKTSSTPKTEDGPEPATESQKPVEKKQGTEVKTVPVKENSTEVKEEVEEKEPANPSQKEEISDSLSSYSDDTISEDDAQVTDVKGDTRLGYYQQSIPEIEIFDGKTNIFEKVKNWINELKNTNSKERISQINNELRNSVRDFVIGHPDYADIYNWLKDKGAFEYISTKLNVNDKLVFYTTDECPKYNDKMQIVVGVVKARNADGEISDIQPLTTLHLANSVSSSNRTKYAYLDELYDAMRKDFTSQEPNGEMWVFGGRKTPITSNVFAIRPGLIPLGGESKDIRQKPGYSESAPIIQYSFDGTPQVLRGTINDLSKVFLPTRSNLKPGENRAGYLYYLVRNGNDTFTPVALHINNMDRYKEIGRDINKAIEEGIIESDVQMLRQKGVNFMFDPWNPKTGKFGRLLGDINTAQQVNYDAELGEVNREERDKKVAEDEKIPFNNLAGREGQTSVQEETSSTSLSIENKNYSKLSEDEKAKVDAKGIPSDVWDTSNAFDRKKLLGC